MRKNKIARPIHDLWNEANKRYQQKQKEELTDIYIKGLLGKRDKTPENIAAKRQEILQKRKALVNTKADSFAILNPAAAHQ